MLKIMLIIYVIIAGDQCTLQGIAFILLSKSTLMRRKNKKERRNKEKT